jgi:CRISPR-associated protein (TIGR02710 family)
MEEVLQGEGSPSLEEVVTTWKALPVSNPVQRERAEQFYREHVFPLVLRLARERQAEASRSGYDLLISSVGTSPEPVILSIHLLQPQRSFLLYTSDSEKYLPYIVEVSGLKPDVYDKRQVEKDDPVSIYAAVHQAVQQARRRLGRDPRVAVDLTGGTKVMSAGCALAAGFLAADIYYVASDYDSLRRRPEPGSEKLVRVEHPYVELGHLELKKARDRFQRHDYRGAAELLNELATRVSRPQLCEAYASLARAYAFWDSLQFREAAESMAEAMDRIRRFRREEPELQELSYDVLQGQKEALEALAAENFSQLSFLQSSTPFHCLLFSIYSNARRREEEDKFDAAFLLLYRTLEMMGQRRLALRGIDTAAVDYQKLNLDRREALERINEKLGSVGLKPLEGTLDSKLPLFQSYGLLNVLQDPFACSIDLRRLKGQIEARNQGIFAHGFQSVKKETYQKFRNFTDDCLQKFAQTEEIDLPHWLEITSFVRLPAA